MLEELPLPNKQLDIVYEFSKSPNVYEHLTFIDFNAQGNAILGCSDISGSFWEGTLLYFTSEKELLTFDSLSHYVYLSAADGKFLNSSTVVLAEESGVLNILDINESDKSIRTVNYFRHGRRIPQLAVWGISFNVLTCSGRSVNIFDVRSIEKKSVFTDSKTHISDVSSVDTLSSNLDCFVSAGVDGKALLWDTRTGTPPLVLYTNEFCSLTRIAANPANDNYFAIGTQGGDSYLIDKREPKEFVSVYNCCVAPVSAMSFNHKQDLAVATEAGRVVILNSGKTGRALSEIYSYTSGNANPVKCVRWHKNQMLYSCGFGKEMKKHCLNS